MFRWRFEQWFDRSEKSKLLFLFLSNVRTEDFRHESKMIRINKARSLAGPLFAPTPSQSTELPVGEVGLRKHRPCPPTLETFGVHTVSVSREDPSLHEH
jgi:hypothetical protein